jgi:hypothetical protein
VLLGRRKELKARVLTDNHGVILAFQLVDDVSSSEGYIVPSHGHNVYDLDIPSDVEKFFGHEHHHLQNSLRVIVEDGKASLIRHS